MKNSSQGQSSYINHFFLFHQLILIILSFHQSLSNTCNDSKHLEALKTGEIKEEIHCAKYNMPVHQKAYMCVPIHNKVFSFSLWTLLEELKPSQCSDAAQPAM